MRYVALRGSDRWYVVSALRKLSKIPGLTRVAPILNTPFMQRSTPPRNNLWYVQQAIDRVRQLAV